MHPPKRQLAANVSPNQGQLIAAALNAYQASAVQIGRDPCRGHRFPSEIIFECVWHYFRFGVSFRNVEEMMGGTWSRG
jgi:hypothetical protein